MKSEEIDFRSEINIASHAAFELIPFDEQRESKCAFTKLKLPC